MGVTGAHTLVGGANDLGAHERPFDSRVTDKVRSSIQHKFIGSLQNEINQQ